MTWLLSSIARELTFSSGAALKLISTDAASSASVAESGCAVVATSGVSLSVVEGAVGDVLDFVLYEKYWKIGSFLPACSAWLMCSPMTTDVGVPPNVNLGQLPPVLR